MPLLFASTLFVSASLLFMVQPMVGKMVLPLLGGSPAVWNACMVFFQALLLLGYLYAHKVAGIESPKKQAAIHLLVLALPLTVFALATAFGVRHTPIAIAESLAPTDERSPILSVLAILTVAIGVPFFVVSTTATLLQKWFVYTGHPAARDPYFLYAASNVGSLLSLLGYPLVIEPRLSIDGQAWVFAVGFGILAAMIVLCARAANNPIGVPPQPSGNGGRKGNDPRAAAKDEAAAQVQPPTEEPPPTLMRKLKWIALAFVPSTLMLGVTFHMTTDIASVPLLWVGPLALYLITFIIAFARVPEWFRVVIGNLAPVMVLLLVFVMISNVKPGTGIELLLYNLTFFAAALMCHYELARDRPSPKYLTEFFLLMSVGGMLGGVFNSLVAPLVFTHAYEFPFALVVACLMVPRLTADEEEARPTVARPLAARAADALPLACVILNAVVLAFAMFWLFLESPRPLKITETVQVAPMQLLCVLAGALLAGVASVVTVELSNGGKPGRAIELWDRLPLGAKAALLVVANPLALPWAAYRVIRTREQLRVFLDVLIPVVVGIGFYLLVYAGRREWFAHTCVSVAETINLPPNTISVIFLYAVPVMICFFFVDRPVRFALAVAAILGPVKYREYTEDSVHSERSFFGILKVQEVPAYVPLRKGDTVITFPEGSKNAKGEDVSGKPMIASRYMFRKLVHGTTLHGTQFAEHERHILDDFQMVMPGLTPWDAVAVAGAIHAYDIRQEPLTYYHRTGPVGAMFSELRRRKRGADERARFAMVGLGTGSASCYAYPGQEISFYEIDPAVKNLVADTDKYFNYVKSARDRRAKLDIRMGDARLVLKKEKDTEPDRKYTLLLVDAFSSDSIPVHLLTVEAVQLYLDRMTDDGMLALHISNKYVKLEPVVAAIANKLGLVARVWNDDSEGKAGKTASSWVVLARKPEHLGELYTPLGDLPFAPHPEPNGDDPQRRGTVSTPTGDYYRYMINMPVVTVLRADYESELEARGGEKNKRKSAELNEAPDPRAAWLGWVDAKIAKTTDPDELARLKLCRMVIDRFGPSAELADVMHALHGHAFRRLETLVEVQAWTDDYSDVLRVMMIPELQRVRKFFGLPTPVE